MGTTVDPPAFVQIKEWPRLVRPSSSSSPPGDCPEGPAAGQTPDGPPLLQPAALTLKIALPILHTLGKALRIPLVVSLVECLLAH